MDLIGSDETNQSEELDLTISPPNNKTAAAAATSTTTTTSDNNNNNNIIININWPPEAKDKIDLVEFIIDYSERSSHLIDSTSLD